MYYIQSRRWRAMVFIVAAGSWLGSAPLAAAQEVAQAAAQPSYAGGNSERAAIAQSRQLQAEGRSAAALAVLRQAAAACTQCEAVRAELATAYCRLGDTLRAAQTRRLPLSQACSQAGRAANAAAANRPVYRSPLRNSPAAAAEARAVPPLLPVIALPVHNAAPNTAVNNAGQSQAGSVNSTAALANAVASARQLLAQREAEAAYELLQPFDRRAEGGASFDYLFGVAALDSGRPGEAVFALRRVVAAQPGFAGARLELGRALYERGDYQHAADLFKQLQAEQPPAAAAKVIKRYQQAIQAQTRHQRISASAYLGAGIGYDSNASAGTEARTLGPFILDPISRRQGSVRQEFSVGGDINVPLSPRWQLVAAADAQLNHFPEAEFVSGNSAQLESGAQYRRGPWKLALLAALHHKEFDGEFNHIARHGRFELERLVGDRWRLQLGYRAGHVRFAPELDVLDINQQLLSVGATRFIAGASQPSLSATVLMARDDAQQANSPYGRNAAGLRTRFARNLGGGRLFATASFLNSNFHEPFATAGSAERRKDAQQWLSLAWVFDNWPSQRWRAVPELLLLNNDSSVELFDYQRGWLMLSLQRHFATGGASQ